MMFEWSQKSSDVELPPVYKFKRRISLMRASFAHCVIAGTEEEVAIWKAKIPSNAPDLKEFFGHFSLARHLLHPNIFTYLELEISESSQFLFFVTNFFPADMSLILRSSQTLSEDHVQYLMYQMLLGICYLHAIGVVCMSLHPSDFLVTENCCLVIFNPPLIPIDSRHFGTFFKDPRHFSITNWYRAPEEFMKHQHYTPAMNLWTAGCIIAELLLRQPIFPGNDFVRQIECIMRGLGRPSDTDLDSVCSLENARRFVNSLSPPTDGGTLADRLRGHSPPAVDLVTKLLALNPAARPSAAEALAHPFFADVWDPQDLAVAAVRNDHAARGVAAAAAAVDAMGDVTETELREMVLQEVVGFREDKQALAARRAAVLMACAPRLGQMSPLGALEPAVVAMIAKMVNLV